MVKEVSLEVKEVVEKMAVEMEMEIVEETRVVEKVLVILVAVNQEEGH